jgi:hypothetical protein
MLNMACDGQTGLFVSDLLTQLGYTARNGVKLILQRALQVESIKEIQINASMIQGDCGYNNVQLLLFCSSIKVLVFVL